MRTPYRFKSVFRLCECGLRTAAMYTLTGTAKLNGC